MQAILRIIFFIVGFAVLIKGADFLIDGASSFARRLKVRELIIGLTIVAFGTSLPELVVNIFSSAGGSTGLAIGNVLGSNIANILLILGISSLIFPLAVTRNTVWKEIPLGVLAALLLGIMANDFLIDKSRFSALTRIDGLVFLAFFIIFLYYAFSNVKEARGKAVRAVTKQYKLPASCLFIILGLVMLFIGGKILVDGAVNLALMLGVSETLIGLTIVAVGTSLPELATSAVAALKKSSDIAVGNIIGSNIFNIFFVLGISSLIRPLPFPLTSIIDIGMVIFASLLLFAFMFLGKRHVLDRWQGILFILIYIAYIAFLVARG